MEQMTRGRHIWRVISVLVLLVVYRVDTATPDSSSELITSQEKAGESPPSKKDDASTGGNGKGSGGRRTFNCLLEDTECNKDKLGYEAISALHRMLDDDKNGNVDQSESDEFLRDELQYTDGFERHSLFHNNDKLISVDDLWRAWKYSEVYNWTEDDVIDWLQNEVDLPQYSSVFMDNRVSGPYLPRLATTSTFVTTILGIKNPVHKQKLSLKAMDTVLFGAPPKRHSYVKDLVLVASLIFAIGGCWFAYLHHRYSQEQVRKMMMDLESLQKAEEALQDVQRKLVDAESRQLSTDEFSERGLAKDDSMPNYGEQQQMKEDLAAMRLKLEMAENQLESQYQYSVPGELQAWLQLTHELEQAHYNTKRQAAERQFQAAKEACDKIKRRNKALFGSLRMAHTNCIDEIDQRILDARLALEEVKQDLQERLHRWHTIERICGFPIITNPGLAVLHQNLHGTSQVGAAARLPGAVVGPMSVEEADEDMPPAAFPTCPIPNGLSRPRALSTEAELAHGLPYTLYPDANLIDKDKMGNFRTSYRRQPRFNFFSSRSASFPSAYCSYPPLQTVSSKTYLRQRAGMGSTGSLSHVSRTGVVTAAFSASHTAHNASHSTLASVHRGSHDEGGASPTSATGSGPVTFHLGEQHSHQHHAHTSSTTRSNNHSLVGYSSGMSPTGTMTLTAGPTVAPSSSAIFSHSKPMNFSDSDDNLSQATLDSIPRSLSSGALRNRTQLSNGLDLVSHTNNSVTGDDSSLSLGGQKKPSKKKKILGIFRKNNKKPV